MRPARELALAAFGSIRRRGGLVFRAFCSTHNDAMLVNITTLHCPAKRSPDA